VSHDPEHRTAMSPPARRRAWTTTEKPPPLPLLCAQIEAVDGIERGLRAGRGPGGRARLRLRSHGGAVAAGRCAPCRGLRLWDLTAKSGAPPHGNWPGLRIRGGSPRGHAGIDTDEGGGGRAALCGRPLIKVKAWRASFRCRRLVARACFLGGAHSIRISRSCELLTRWRRRCNRCAWCDRAAGGAR